MLERIVDPAYHSAGMGRTCFGTDKAPAILQRLQTLYGKQSLGGIDAALLRLNDHMERNQPVEVVIQAIEEVQLFLLSHPEDNMSLSDIAWINYNMIKIIKTGIYSKALARWNAKTSTKRNVW